MLAAVHSPFDDDDDAFSPKAGGNDFSPSRVPASDFGTSSFNQSPSKANAPPAVSAPEPAKQNVTPTNAPISQKVKKEGRHEGSM